MKSASSLPWAAVPVRLAIRLGRLLWELIPGRILHTRFFRKLGCWIHRAHVKWEIAEPSQVTPFLRNTPLCELLRDLVAKVPYGRMLRVASFGCKTGAELYSLLWYLRTARPDLYIFALGADAFEQGVEKADRGEYAKNDDELTGLPPTMGPALLDSIGDRVRVKDWLRNDIRWMVADANDAELSQRLEPVHFLLANDFLAPMPAERAEACLENLLGLVLPGGYLVVEGVDLDLKTRFAAKHGLVPICEKMEAINRADRAKAGWPWKRWAAEPIEKGRLDWQTRYAVVFATPLTSRRERRATWPAPAAA